MSYYCHGSYYKVEAGGRWDFYLLVKRATQYKGEIKSDFITGLIKNMFQEPSSEL